MLKKIVFTLMVSVFFLSLICGERLDCVAIASQSVISVPEDFETIQEAINAANPGDTIQVSARTYHELLTVNKTIHLVGEDPHTTIIDGDKNATVVKIVASNVEVRGFTIKNGKSEFEFCGILVFNSNNVTISNSIIRENYYGIDLRDCDNCIIFGNTIVNNSYTGINVRGNNNVFYANTIANNTNGVLISVSTAPNTFYHNNFVNNTKQALFFSFNTKWDNEAEGNFWSDYQGSDGNGDGIGDTTYPDMFGWDKYPLMEPWSQNRIFPVSHGGETYYISIQSNCTIASFNLTLRQLSFRITGPSDSKFFCNITIPKVIFNKTSSEKWLVQVNDTDVTTKSFITENAFEYFINLSHKFGSSYEVRIQIVEATIFDFSPYLIAVGIAIVMIGVIIGLAIAIFKRRKKTTSNSFSCLHVLSFIG